ncbi:MAG: hypothetical protein ACPL06_03750 [Candidatus Anstonellales archaeon]
MTKEHFGSTNDEYAKLVAVGVIALMVGIIIGPMIMPAQPTVENKTEVFTPNMEKISEIKKIFEGYYYLQTGNKTTLSYVNASDLGNLVLITYATSTPDGSSLQVYATKDYEYLIPSVIPTENLKASIEAAIQQLANRQNTQAQEAPKSEKPDVKLYIMSFCPYGNIAEQAFNSVIHTLGDTFTFEPIYIIYDETISPQYSAQNTEYCTVDGNVTYCSMHGMNELRQGVREIAVYRLYGSGTWADYVNAVDEQCSLQNIEDCWKTAAEGMNLNTSEIEAYYNEHMYEILADQKEKTFSAEKFGSPSIAINGQDYSGARTSEAFKMAICNAFITQPENCNATLSATQTAPSGSCG